MEDKDSNNNHDAEAAGMLSVDVRRVTSSENNAFLLEQIIRDECPYLHIRSDDNDEYTEEVNAYFVVREGDDMNYLGNFIGKSNHLKTLILHHMPLNASFRNGLAANKSIQQLYIWNDLGKEGFRYLAPFFKNTNTLQELKISLYFSSTDSLNSIASLLSQCQIPSLKRFYFEDMELDDNVYTEFARALRMQSQLELLSLPDISGDNHDSLMGHITLGDTMKHWRSPFLKVLDIGWRFVDDDGMVALVEGMAKCSSLERLEVVGNDTVTELGLRALSSLFQSKKFLRLIDLSEMNISDDKMAVIATGLASLRSLKTLNLSDNNIGDVGLKALSDAQPEFLHLEGLHLGSNTSFSAVGLESLSSVLHTVSRLKFLDLSNNAIDDEGLRAFTMGMKDQCTIERLDISNNSISSGVRSLARMDSLRRLNLDGNNIDEDNGAMVALVEAMESLCNLDYLALSGITSSELSVLAPVFQYEKSCLLHLELYETRLEDSGAIILANGLKGNTTMKEIDFDAESLTDVGWSAFESLLCDTSSLNNTYLSNHTLEGIGDIFRLYCPPSIKTLLRLNKKKDQGVNAPICKILMSHSNFDMTPLLQWKLKLLPHVVTWFERARSSHPTQPWEAMESRKLSALYQFVSGASHAVLEGNACSKNQAITNSSSRKRKIDQCDQE